MSQRIAEAERHGQETIDRLSEQAQARQATPVASAFQSLDTNAQAARTLFRQTGATDDDIYKVYLAPGGKGSAAMVQDAELVRTGKIKATK
jgi:hypothetical protein